MAADDPIDAILGLVPSDPERAARARRALQARPPDELRAIESDLMALTKRGQLLLDQVPEADRRWLAARDRQRLVRITAAKDRLMRLQQRIESRRLQPSEAPLEPAEAAELACHSVRICELSALSAKIRHSPIEHLPRVSDNIPAIDRLVQREISQHEGRDYVSSSTQRELAQLLGHPYLGDNPTLSRAEIEQAIARVENFILDYRPDVIAAINSEGQAIARLVTQDLGLSIPAIDVNGTAEGGLAWAAMSHLRKVPRVCIVGHVAWGGRTLDRAVHEARAHWGTDEIHVVVLATSLSAIAKLGAVARFAFHQLATGPARLQLEASKVRLGERQDSFPAGSAHAPDVVFAREALRSQRSLMQRYFSVN